MQTKDWFHEWLIHYVKPASKQKTYSRYRDIVSRIETYLRNKSFGVRNGCQNAVRDTRPQEFGGNSKPICTQSNAS